MKWLYNFQKHITLFTLLFLLLAVNLYFAYDSFTHELYGSFLIFTSLMSLIILAIITLFNVDKD